MNPIEFLRGPYKGRPLQEVPTWYLENCIKALDAQRTQIQRTIENRTSPESSDDHWTPVDNIT